MRRQLEVPRLDKESQKRSELCGLLEKNFEIEGNSQQVLKFLENEQYLEIEPPRSGEPRAQFVCAKSVRHGNIRGGYSYKPGNICLNIKHSIMASSATLLSAGLRMKGISADNPLASSLSILAALLSAVGLFKVAVPEQEVLVLLMLWRLNEQGIPEERAYLRVNEELKEYDFPEMMESQFHSTINSLADMRCIEILGGKIILKEKIVVRY